MSLLSVLLRLAFWVGLPVLLVAVVIGPRRAGDAAALVSSPTRAEQELGWEPRHSTLQQMIGDAWAWAQKPGFTA